MRIALFGQGLPHFDIGGVIVGDTQLINDSHAARVGAVTFDLDVMFAAAGADRWVDGDGHGHRIGQTEAGIT